MKKLNLNIIVSISNNNCIGANNTLLWKQSNDLKRFKQLTESNIVIMGQKTYESLPFKPLKNRINIIISDNEQLQYDGCIMANSIEDSIKKADILSDDKEVFIIGGGSIYRQFFNIATKLYITRINVNIDGDTYFPEILDSQWIKTYEEKHLKDDKNEYDYTFEIYEPL